MASVLKNMESAHQRLAEGYAKWDIDAIMEPRSEDYIYQRLPKSIAGPPQTNAEYRQSFGGVMKYFTDFKIYIDSTAFDVDNCTCVMHLTSSAQTPVGPYENEYAFFLWFDDSGEKITKVLEFVDSAYTQELFMRLHKHIGERREGGSGSV